MFVIEPIDPAWGFERRGGRRLAPGFRYSSDANDVWLSLEEMKKLCDD